MRPGRHRSETGPVRDSDETKALRLEMAKYIATTKFEPEAERLKKMGAPKEQILELSKKVDEFADYLYCTHSKLLDNLAERRRRALDSMARHAGETGSNTSLSNLGKQGLAKLGAEFKAFLSDSGHSETGQRPATDSTRTAEPKTTRTGSNATPTRETGRTAPETKPVSEKKPAGSETTPSSTPKDTSDLKLLREAAKSARMRAEAAAGSLQDQVRDSTETVKRAKREGTRVPKRDAVSPLSDARDCPDRPERSVLAESKIVSETDLQRAISFHAEVRLRKDFDVVYSDAVRCVHGQPDSGKEGRALVRELERLELRRAYESVHGGPPAVRIESMEDLRQLADRLRSLSPKEVWLCEKYFELKDICSTNQRELSRAHEVPDGYIWKWSLGIEPVPIRDVRRDEEDRTISEWAARTESSALNKLSKADQETDALHSDIRRLPLVSRSEAERACSTCAGEIFSPEDAASVVKDMVDRVQDTRSRVFCVNVGEESVLGEQRLNSFRSVIHEDRELVEKSLEGAPLSDGSVPRTRLALVDGVLYVWRPDANPVSLINAYGGLYFYFKDDKAFARLMESIKETRDGDGAGGLYKTLKFSEKLVREMFGDDLLPSHVQDPYARVRGEHLHLLLDLLGRPLESLEGEISRVAGPNGRGGISEPRFPNGRELDLAIGCLTGVVLTDCNMKNSGVISLTESELPRIRIIERSLRALGEISLDPRWEERSNSYVVAFPSVLGRILLRLGVPGGDRTIQNPGLPKAVFGLSWEGRCAVVENIVPQDGSVQKSCILWTHSNALHPGKKGEKYGVQPIITDDEIAFIKEHGREKEKWWVLPVGKLEKLMGSPQPDTAFAASKLLDKTNRSRNRLIEDGRVLAESIGVDMKVAPCVIHCFKKTGRVTISWDLRTASIGEAVKLAVIAPPDDVKKRQAAKELLVRKPKIVERILRELTAKGINTKQWWKDA